MTEGDAFDETAFLAAATSCGEGCVAFLEQLFARARTAGMHLDHGAGPVPAAVGWCVLDGTPAIAWVATVDRDARLEVLLAPLLERASSPPFDGIVRTLASMPLLGPTLEGIPVGMSVQSVVLAVDELVADPAQVATLLDVFDQIAGASTATFATSRSVIGAYEWGERGEHGS